MRMCSRMDAKFTNSGEESSTVSVQERSSRVFTENLKREDNQVSNAPVPVTSLVLGWMMSTLKPQLLSSCSVIAWFNLSISVFTLYHKIKLIHGWNEIKSSVTNSVIMLLIRFDLIGVTWTHTRSKNSFIFSPASHDTERMKRKSSSLLFNLYLSIATMLSFLPPSKRLFWYLKRGDGIFLLLQTSLNP